MASISIDLTNRLFIESGTAADGDTSWDVVQDFYLPWKALLRADFQNLGFPQAMRYVGLDPLTDLQDLGASYFFLNNFKFKPGEWDHEVEIVGNLWADPFTNKIVVPTDGGYTVLIRQRVSNLVDAAVARLDLNQLLQSIYIDVANGVSGTESDVGTPTNPVNNIDDAITIANSRNLTSFHINGSLTLDRDITNWSFIGLGNHLNNDLFVSGYNVDGSFFNRVNLNGTMQGRIEAQNCGINLLSGVDGVLQDCGIINDFTLAADAVVILDGCFSEVSSIDEPDVTFANNAILQMRNYSGGIEIVSMDSSNMASIDLDPGTATFNANCTGGSVIVRGVGQVVDNSGNVTINADGTIAHLVWDTDKTDHQVDGSIGEKLANPLVLQRGDTFNTEVEP